MEGTENHVANGDCEAVGDTAEQQYEAEQPNLLKSFDEMDNKIFDFEAHFNGAGEEFDDGSVENRWGKKIIKKNR